MSRMQRWSFMVQTGALAGLARQHGFGLSTVAARPFSGAQ